MADIDVSQITDVTHRALSAHGASDAVARIMADAVSWAEARGNRICGLYYLESYCQQLVTGRVTGDVTPDVTQPRSATVEVDAGYGFAQPAFAAALNAASAAAREAGIASLFVRHAHTCTALGWFTEAIAKAGLIGMGYTNASPIVAPPGGKTRVIGTNPMSFAVPDGQGGVAMMFDQSTTSVALGRITMANAAGEPIPEGWALDAEGRPTTDPAEALKGSMTSAGAYKGWGFGLMAEFLAAGMTGSLASMDVKPLKAPQGDPHDLGQYYILIDPSASDAFADRVNQVAAAVAADQGTRMPGEGKAPQDPVEVGDAVWAQMRELAKYT